MPVISRLIDVVIRSNFDPSASSVFFNVAAAIRWCSASERRRDASATLWSRVIGFQRSRQLGYYALGDLEWLRRSKRVHADYGFGRPRYPGPREPVDRIVKNGPMLKAADIQVAFQYTAQEKQ
jgi:hypothetical protein